MDDEYAQMQARAREKYRLLRSSRIPANPVGRRFAFGEHGCIWTGIALFMALPGCAAIFAGLSDPEVSFFIGVGLFLICFSLVCLIPSGIVRLAPTTPDRALRNFYEFIARKSFRSAWDMVSPLEKEAGNFPCRSFEEFRDYWKQARKELKLRAGKLFFESGTFIQLDTDLTYAQFQLDAQGHAIILASPIAVGFIQTGGTSYAAAKLLVRHGDEWFMWCGEFCGAEERELSWFYNREQAT